MQVLLQVLINLTQYTQEETEYIEYRKNKPSVSFTRKDTNIKYAIDRGSNVCEFL